MSANFNKIITCTDCGVFIPKKNSAGSRCDACLEEYNKQSILNKEKQKIKNISPHDVRDICSIEHNEQSILEEKIILKKHNEKEFLFYKDKTHFEIVLNTKYGGFGISKEATAYFLNLHINNGTPKVILDTFQYKWKIKRHDHLLVKTVRELGKKAYSSSARLCIVRIPIVFLHTYEIEDYDGRESVNCDIADVIAKKIRDIDTDISPEDSKKILLEFKQLQKTYANPELETILLDD